MRHVDLHLKTIALIALPMVKISNATPVPRFIERGPAFLLLLTTDTPFLMLVTSMCNKIDYMEMNHTQVCQL